MIEDKSLIKLSERVRQLEDTAEEVIATLKSTHLAEDIRKVAFTLKEVLRMNKKYGSEKQSVCPECHLPDPDHKMDCSKNE